MTGRALTVPRRGDVLIARRTATVEYDVAIVPDGRSVAPVRYGVAAAAGRDAATQLGVDLWITEDHIHFWRLATYREASSASDARARTA